MTEYERHTFGTTCPYTENPCYDKIPCVRCRANEEEKELMQMLEEMERLEDDAE